MINKLKDLRLTLKTTIIIGIVLSAILFSLNAFSIIYTKDLITKKVNVQLTNRLHDLEQTIETFDELLKSTADSLYYAFDSKFDNININRNKSILIKGVKTPEITNNGIILNNNFDFVDNYTKIKGSTATIFVRMGDDFVRVSTSLKRLDGTRTIGTFLGKNSPAYESIMQGKKYFGDAYLFGNNYMAVYNPIIKNGEIVGILYIGLNYTKSYNNLKKRLSNIIIGETGYVYILSTKSNSLGKTVLHPSLVNKSMYKFKDTNNYYFIKDMFNKGRGSVEYKWKGEDKISFYENYENRNWKIIITASKNDFLKESKEYTLILTILSIVSLIFIIICVYFIIRLQVLKPLTNLQNALDDFFQFLNNNNHNIKLIDVSCKDEIGQMSELLNKNVEKIQANIIIDNELIKNTVDISNYVKEGHLSKRITLNTNNQKLDELKNVVNSMLDSVQKNVNIVQNVLESYSSYDYTKNIDISNIEGEIKELSIDVNSLGIAISSMLKDNLLNAYSLTDNSKNLSSIMTNLSSSSNEQAASLEETAASIEELTSTMTNNENNMTVMSNNSKELQNSIIKGKELANKTVKAMEEINVQTNSIAEAITVIDQIAFQTNILSLNAAVEAATAGEAGKGFAVVAQEVRNLASRSAEAAKEIKDIVIEASIKTTEGKDIANNMINDYENLNNNIHTNADMIEDVLNNFKEQVRGIEQINNAVSSLDIMTQENASIANNANDISILTDTIASKIVEDTNKNDFIGKNTF